MLKKREVIIRPIKQNIILNMLKTVMLMLFPLITFPYIARILGPSNIGVVNFSNAFVAYFIIFSSLGIPLHGMREISKVRENREDRSKVFFEIFIINLISTIIISILYIFVVKFLNLPEKDKNLLYLFGLMLVFKLFSVDWFFIGIEDLKYITIRSLIVKLISLVLIFSFIRTSKNFFVYAIILVFSNSGANVFNFFRATSFISYKQIGNISLRRHIKPILISFLTSAAVSIYINLDKVMLGFMSTKAAVGYYTAANNIIRMVVEMVVSVGVVLAPRAANLVHNNDIGRYLSTLNKSFSFLLFFSLPASVGLFLVADFVISVFAGAEYESAVLCMKIMSSLPLLIGMANFFGIQILYANNREKYYLIAISVAALLNISANYLLIPRYAEVGASIGSFIAEFTGCLLLLIFSIKVVKLKMVSFSNFKYLIATVAMTSVVMVISYFLKTNGSVLKLFIAVVMGALTYVIALLVLKEKIFLRIIFGKISKLFERG